MWTHGHAIDCSQLLSDCKDIQKGLSWMFSNPITSVDHWPPTMSCCTLQTRSIFCIGLMHRSICFSKRKHINTFYSWRKKKNLTCITYSDESHTERHGIFMKRTRSILMSYCLFFKWDFWGKMNMFIHQGYIKLIKSVKDVTNYCFLTQKFSITNKQHLQHCITSSHYSSIHFNIWLTSTAPGMGWRRTMTSA